MTAKVMFLRPRLNEALKRLQTLVDLDAPAYVVGATAWSVYTLVLSMYGSKAGLHMVNLLTEYALHQRGVCGYDDCIHTVPRPADGLCAFCRAKLTEGEEEEEEPHAKTAQKGCNDKAGKGRRKGSKNKGSKRSR